MGAAIGPAARSDHSSGNRCGADLHSWPRDSLLLCGRRIASWRIARAGARVGLERAKAPQRFSLAQTLVEAGIAHRKISGDFFGDLCRQCNAFRHLPSVSRKINRRIATRLRQFSFRLPVV